MGKLQSKNVVFTLLLIITILAIVIFRFRNEPPQRELFDRHPKHLTYTHHALCRMDCRHISDEDIHDIMENGIINLNKSDQNDRPCPTYALQGYTSHGEELRVIFAQCDDDTKLVTCYNLKEDFECHCPGDERKNH